MPELIPGVAFALSPLVRRILAPDAGVAPGPGTNTYLVGIDEVAVIDPGPDDADHLQAIIGCGGDRIRWVLVSHAHGGHATGAIRLRDRTGAEVAGFGGRTLELDRRLEDGDQIVGTEFRLTALHTPGHAPDHLCFLLEEERVLFSGDHVALDGEVAPGPDGDLDLWREHLRRLHDLRLRSIAPGHGELIEDPAAAIESCLRKAGTGAP